MSKQLEGFQKTKLESIEERSEENSVVPDDDVNDELPEVNDDIHDKNIDDKINKSHLDVIEEKSDESDDNFFQRSETLLSVEDFYSDNEEMTKEDDDFSDWTTSDDDVDVEEETNEEEMNIRQVEEHALFVEHTEKQKYSVEAESIALDILEHILDTIIASHTQEFLEEISFKKLRHKAIEEVKITIDNVKERYGEQGTEHARPISYLWMKGEARDDLLDMLDEHKQRKVIGEEKLSSNPYILSFAYGYSTQVPILNLSKGNKLKIGVACAHSFGYFNYKKMSLKLFQGHRNMVQSIATDSNGKFVASADCGPQNTITIWDMKRKIPVKTYFTPHSEGTRFVSFDPNAIYLVTVSLGQQMISIWDWTQPAKKPEASVLLPNNVPPIKSICFSPDMEQYAVLTSDRSIVCVTLPVHSEYLLNSTEDDKLKSEDKPYKENTDDKMKVYVSDFQQLKKCGILTDSVYVPNTHLVYSSTSKGYVIYWSDTDFLTSFCNSPSENLKVQVNKIKLSNESINVMQCIKTTKRLIVTGDSAGRISFYDCILRILFWCETNESVTSIRFNCVFRERKTRIVCPPGYHVTRKKGYKPASTCTKQSKKKSGILKSSLYKMAEKQKIRVSKPVPPDLTLGHKPFYALNFIISSSNGNVYYVKYTTSEMILLMRGDTAHVTAIAAHPNKDYIYIGNERGQLFLYDFSFRYLMIEKSVECNKESRDFEQPITCIGISNIGLELAVGLQNGGLYFFDSVLLEKEDIVFHNTHKAIRKIIFDKNCNFMVLLDDHMCISLYGMGKEKNYMGKYKAHYQSVTDIMFTFRESKLFSIGKDKRLVSYKTPQKFQESINVDKFAYITHFSQPLCIIEYPTKVKTVEMLLVADDAFKYKIINSVTLQCIKTTQGPSLPSPIKFMILLPKLLENENIDFLAYGTNTEIGIQMLPLDGNPYKYLSYIGSPTDLISICLGCEGDVLFTASRSDPSVLVWLINSPAVRMSAHYGGEKLSPYYAMIDGGYDGRMFKEIKDFFYYFQIVHDGEYIYGSRSVSDKIHLCDVINYFTALGYFPSVKEAADIIAEVKGDSDKPDSEIELTFEEVVILYLNQRPAKGVFERELRKAFYNYIYHSCGDMMGSTESNFFMQGLSQYGEPFTLSEYDIIMDTLIEKKNNPDSEAYNFDLNGNVNLPEFITYKYFVKDLLGIDPADLNIDLDVATFVTEPKTSKLQDEASFLNTALDFWK